MSCYVTISLGKLNKDYDDVDVFKNETIEILCYPKSSDIGNTLGNLFTYDKIVKIKSLNYVIKELSSQKKELEKRIEYLTLANKDIKDTSDILANCDDIINHKTEIKEIEFVIWLLDGIEENNKYSEE